MPSQAQLPLVFVLGILACLGFELYWEHVPYPGQLLVVLAMLGGFLGVMVFLFRTFNDENFVQIGRAAFGAVCFLLLFPLSGIFIRMLRWAFQG